MEKHIINLTKTPLNLMTKEGAFIVVPSSGEIKLEHVLFDNIDRDRIVKVRALVEAAEQSVQADGAEAAANGLVYKVEWVDAGTIRLTPRR